MPNKNYIKGRRYEYKIMNKLKEAGLPIVLRSAQSHSPIDVIGIDILHKTIYLYQCKAGHISDTMKIYLEEEWKGLNNKFDVKFRVV